LAARLANADITIARKVGETEALYGSVTSSDIAEALAAKGIEIDRRKLQLRSRSSSWASSTSRSSCTAR
jgi:large subunit ribosomal protein L9